MRDRKSESVRSVLSVLLFAALGYLGLGVCLYVFQRQMIYHPVSPAASTDLASLVIDSEGEQIKVWVVNESQDQALIYFGGNAENVAYSAIISRWLPCHTLYLVNYRGYAGSSGRPSEPALSADAQRVFDRVAAGHTRVSAIGRSLGSGVATDLAARRKLDKLVLVTPFDSLARVASALFPIYPVSWLLEDVYDNVSKAQEINAPILIVAAEHDEVIATRHARALAAAFAPDQVRYETIAGAGHNTIDHYEQYARALRRFFYPGTDSSDRCERR